MKPTTVLIAVHFSTSAKFRGNIKIPWKKANSAAQLEIPWTVENCEPYLTHAVAGHKPHNRWLVRVMVRTLNLQ